MMYFLSNWILIPCAMFMFTHNVLSLGKDYKKCSVNANTVYGVNVSGKQSCTGVLLGNNKIMTAAHCLPTTIEWVVNVFSVSTASDVRYKGISHVVVEDLSIGEIIVSVDLAIVTLSEGDNKLPQTIINIGELNVEHDAILQGFGTEDSINPSDEC